MTNNQNSYSNLLNKAILVTKEQLTSFAFKEELLTNLTTAFGDKYDRQAVSLLITQWQTGTFDSFPEIEIRSSAEINGANGAYSADTSKIYIAEELLNSGNSSLITDVLLEEYGHFVDSSINKTDTTGDEGNIFANLVQGKTLTEWELAALRTENDKATISLDGQVMEIEQAAGDAIGVSRSTGDYQIDALLGGTKWANNRITYSFFDGGDYYGGETNPREVSNQTKSNIRYILENTIESLVNVDFVEVSDAGKSYGQLRYLLSDGPSYAYAYYPSNSETGGDVHLNPQHNWGEGAGSGNYSTLVHETLHALGLKHPGDYNGDGPGDSPFLPANEDNGLNTVMSYYRGAKQDNPNTAMDESKLPVNTGPESYDLKALEYLYGDLRATGNESHSGKGTNTDDLYVFDTDTQQGSDTINETTIALKTHHNTYVRADALRTTYQSDQIDTWEEFQVIDVGDGKIGLQTFHNRYLRANTLLIVDQADALNKFEKFKLIDRGAGKIALQNHWGDWGKTANSYIQARWVRTMSQSSNLGDWETFTPIARNRDRDTLDFSVTTTKNINLDLNIAGKQKINGNLSLTLGTTLGSKSYVDIENAVGGSLDDRLLGNQFNNLLRGNDGNDILDGRQGNDSLVGGSGNDALSGWLGRDKLYGGSGNDDLWGQQDNDTLYGDDGDDTLRGHQGDDLLMGGTGNDVYYFDADYSNGVDRISETRMAFKTFHKKYLRAGNPTLPHGDTNWNINQNGSINTWESFEIIPNANGTKVGIKTFHNKYFRAGNPTLPHGDTDWSINQNGSINTWELFEIIPNANGTVAFKTFHNKYLRAGNPNLPYGDTDWSINQKDSINTWESFTPIKRNPDSHDELNFSETTSQSINIDLSNHRLQKINANLSLVIDSAFGIEIENVVGGSQSDNIIGNSLNNIITGGTGNDNLTGGAGADRFVFNSASEGIDIITDFNAGQQGDRIQISKSGFGSITNTDNFRFNVANNSLLFGTQQIATLENVISFNVATDIILV